MKKIIAIFFFTIYLFSSTEAHQLLKLPVIFQHFAEHKKLNAKITFLQFLDMHYMHGSPKDDDYDRDMQLPFKTFDDCISSTAPAYVSTMLEIIVDNTIAKAEKLKRLPQNKFTLSSYLSNIWQPPKAF